MVAGMGLAASRFLKATSEQRYTDGRASNEAFDSAGGAIQVPQPRTETSLRPSG